MATNIDTFISGVFGNGGDVAYYQNERPGSNRREDLPPRPVFAGSDAHSFEDLESWLGRELRGSTHKNVTWVKADPTFEGLLQTAIEPTERVRIQATKPDRKQPYQVITSVCFQDEHNFPTTIDFNQNLVSIIGSRSSGKSSLLAHIAHAVDSTYTQRQQFDSGFYTSLSETGPAAGRTWGETPDDICQVKWGGSGEITGRVIYIPQNSLFNLNERSAEITSKIAPILFRADPAFEASHRQVAADVEAIGTEVREHVRKWFERTLEIGITTEKIVGVGDPQAIRRQKETLTAQLADQRAKLALAADDIAKYQALTESLSKLREEKSEAFDDLKELSPYLTPEPSQSEPKVAPRVSVTIATSPAPQTLPAPIQDVIANLVDEASEALRLAIGDVLVAQHKELVLKVSRVDAELDRLQTENAELISQSEANTVIDEIVKQLTQQDSALSLIEKYETELSISVESRDKCIQGLIEKLEQRSRLIDDHLSYFGSGPVAINGMQLGIEGGYDEEKLQLLSQDFDQRTNTDFVERNVGLQIEQVLAKPADFLTALSRGEQKLKQGRSIAAVAEQVLSVVPDFRFFAELEGDRIGGFGRSSMTPGKQAMFALQLILSESEDHWPLLIDQPEDDLDSRSIYDHVVPYLKKRKTERQVIMVTHNANLVVGADSEQVIVANRHAADSKNAGERTFDYLAGSLEHTRAYKERQHRLESCGIREHTCEILDGGTEAFQKRKDKYRV